MTSSYPSITVQPLNSLDFVSTLRSFVEMLRTCMGPKAGVKVLISSGGISTITTSSSRLLNSLPVVDPVCLMATQVMKSQTITNGDHGLYIGLLTCCTMEQVLSQDRVPHEIATDLIQQFASLITSLLKENPIKLSIDFTTVKQLFPVVRTILVSKPACGLTKEEITTLCVQVVKSFLTSVDNEFGEVMIMSAGACSGQSSMICGVLYQHTDMEEKALLVLEKQFFENNCEIPLLLFNIMLTNGESPEHRRDLGEIIVENTPDVIKQAMNLLEQAVKFNVGIVACQKVVHESLCLYLRRNGIVVLQRMGTELTRAVEKLSGAKPISSLTKLTPDYIESCLGHIGSAKLVTHSHKQYVLLEKAGSNVITLLLYSPNEESYAELKVVTEQALGALRQLLLQPFVIPGAGCLEVWLASRLQIKVMQEYEKFQCTKSQLEAAVGWLQRAFLLAGGFSKSVTSTLHVDSEYSHAWQEDVNDDSVCCCGLVTADNILNKKGKWFKLNHFQVNGMLLSNSCILDDPKTPEILLDTAIVDVYFRKSNAIKLALESCIHLLSIGLTIYKPPV